MAIMKTITPTISTHFPTFSSTPKKIHLKSKAASRIKTIRKEMLKAILNFGLMVM